MRRIVPSIRLAAVLAVASWTAASAQSGDLGRYEYETYCAVCHGVEGKGGGPFSMLLNKRVPDLTVLAKNNSGVFPVMRVRETILGRADIPGHGPREMPIWGDVYDERARSQFGRNPDPGDVQAYVRVRVAALADYLARLQE
jgi:mono/diheme cytochrome c family protein